MAASTGTVFPEINLLGPRPSAGWWARAGRAKTVAIRVAATATAVVFRRRGETWRSETRRLLVAQVVGKVVTHPFLAGMKVIEFSGNLDRDHSLMVFDTKLNPTRATQQRRRMQSLSLSPKKKKSPREAGRRREGLRRRRIRPNTRQRPRDGERSLGRLGGGGGRARSWRVTAPLPGWRGPSKLCRDGIVFFNFFFGEYE